MTIAAVRDIILTGELPASFGSIFPSYDFASDKIVAVQEGDLWDFKQEFPFSRSDDYFGGIIRLVCAFANTNGGLIIFGVHDQKRSTGHNKVKLDIEQFNNYVRTHLSAQIQCAHRAYDLSECGGKVDVLLVPPRKPNTLPVRSKFDIGKYTKGRIWVRQGHEVVEAEPRHVSLLYCRSEDERGEQSDRIVQSALPPSPATVKRFVGRLPAIDKLFEWLLLSDEPRIFLFGKGGSGKTTIAYEFARVLKSEGGNLRMYGGMRLDQVIFVSAKERKLETVSGKAVDSDSTDFETEDELYRAILALGGWSNSDAIYGLSGEALRAEVAAFFDLSSSLIVIDDVDTLTTKGREAGFDFLYRTLCRCKSGSKVLYTLRNAPSHSLANAIEVPGLDSSGEYQEFVKVCAAQFRVSPPSVDFINDRLASVSERRPLVIETIVGIRRTCDGYDRALAMFESHVGDDARSYVFQREWASLPPDNRARHLLAALAVFDRPAEFEELTSVLQFTESTLRDAILDVSEIFVIIDSAADKSFYSLGDLTRSFVMRASAELELFPLIETRVGLLKKKYYPKNPQISAMELNVTRILHGRDSALANEKLKEIWSNIKKTKMPASTTEDPRFRALLGRIACEISPPLIYEARAEFEFCSSMNYEVEFDTLKRWYEAERSSGLGLQKCESICDQIVSGRSYKPQEKGDFLIRRAAISFNKAIDRENLNPTDAVNLYRDALIGHMYALHYNVQIDSPRIFKSEEFTQNTAYRYFNFCLHAQVPEEIFEFLAFTLKESKPLIMDPVVEPFLAFLQRAETHSSLSTIGVRFSGRLSSFVPKLREAKRLFESNSASRRMFDAMSAWTRKGEVRRK